MRTYVCYVISKVEGNKKKTAEYCMRLCEQTLNVNGQCKSAVEWQTGMDEVSKKERMKQKCILFHLWKPPC